MPPIFTRPADTFDQNILISIPLVHNRVDRKLDEKCRLAAI
jgi:hypothetical protein